MTRPFSIRWWLLVYKKCIIRRYTSLGGSRGRYFDLMVFIEDRIEQKYRLIDVAEQIKKKVQRKRDQANG